MKIILSRKGFDSTTAGGGSSSFVYEDKCYPLPIPEVGTGIKYEDLVFDKEKDISILSVMRDLNINQFTECHFDPYLSDYMLKNKNNVDWKKSLGQCGSAQGHLINNGIKKDTDTLFLFYGWFNKLERINGKFKYSPFNNYSKEGVHLIYGYLQVETILEINKNNTLKDWGNHPHEINKNYYLGENRIYVARDKFSEDDNLDGAGLFKFSKELILTEIGKSRANWEFPIFFHPDNGVEITYLPNNENKWKKENDKAKVKAYGQFQESVVKKDKNKLIENWAIDLIKNHSE